VGYILASCGVVGKNPVGGVVVDVDGVRLIEDTCVELIVGEDELELVESEDEVEFDRIFGCCCCCGCGCGACRLLGLELDGITALWLYN